MDRDIDPGTGSTEPGGSDQEPGELDGELISPEDLARPINEDFIQTILGFDEGIQNGNVERGTGEGDS